MTANAYGLLAIAGIMLTAIVWSRLTRHAERRDGRLVIIYFAGLLGAVVGAKLAFLLAEGWPYRHSWLALLTGRSITGGLLGGYACVELAKRAVGYPRATGDLFAIVVPIGIALGRVGCLLQGCCPGIACEPAWWTIVDGAGVTRWPAAAVELGFNLVLLAWALLATRRGWQTGNRFHVYLMAYGLFRFGHEFLRANEPLASGVGGYHLLALAIAGLGLIRFRQRRAQTATGPVPAAG